MRKTIRFSRQELFDRVWSTPLLVLAKEIGISDVALGKACRRARLPLPGRGYWAKPEQRRRKVPLPASKNHDQMVIEFTVLDRDALPALVPKKPSELQSVVVVAAELINPHSLVAKTLKASNKAKTRDGRLVLSAHAALDLNVSPDGLDRALRIMDALIKASENEGCQWQLTSKGQTILTCNGETMPIVLTERFTKRDLPPRQPPKSQSKARTWSPPFDPTPPYPGYEWVGTGELAIKIDRYTRQPVRQNWRDGKRQKLEGKLADLIATLSVVADAIRVDREANEAAQREREAAEARAKARARKAEIRRRLQNRFVTALERWERSKRLMAFCAEVEARASELSGDQAASAARWLEWARSEADCLNPLHDLEALTSMQVDLPDRFTGLFWYDKPKINWWTILGEE